MNILHDACCKEFVVNTEPDESEFTQVEAARAIDNILCMHGVRSLLDYVAWALSGRPQAYLESRKKEPNEANRGQ